MLKRKPKPERPNVASVTGRSNRERGLKKETTFEEAAAANALVCESDGLGEEGGWL
jgi:hypothetical protein